VHPQGSRVRDSDSGLNLRPNVGEASEFFDVPEWVPPVGPEVPRRGPPNAPGVAGAGPEALVTSRNNSNPDPWRGPWRPTPGYVAACCRGTLALHYGEGRVVFGALACRSWSCPHCRPRLAAQVLDRLRRGLEARAGSRLTFATLTLDPQRFGAYVVGRNRQPDGRWTNLVSMPSPEQFGAAVAAMSKEWNRLVARLSSKARRADAEKVGYFRVVELHRNGWPHYHAVLEHPEWGPEELRTQLEGWGLGRVDLREVSVDDAVGELAPYLVSAEKKSGGSKAYQFAALALPKGARLYSASQGFLGAVPEPEERPDYALPLRGHFAEYHRALQDMGADARLLLHPATPDGSYLPPSRTVATGDAAVVYFAALVEAKALHLSGAMAEQATRQALAGSPGLPQEAGASSRGLGDADVVT
jgi:hypothetical protein